MRIEDYYFYKKHLKTTPKEKKSKNFKKKLTEVGLIILAFYHVFKSKILA